MLLAWLTMIILLAILGMAVLWTFKEIARVHDGMARLQARLERAYGVDLVADSETGVYSLSGDPFIMADR